MGREPLTQEAALERLARRLWTKMEHLDPTIDGDDAWIGLAERRRDFYRLCVEDLFLDEEAIRSVIG